MDIILRQMIVIYKPEGIDWMEYKLSRNNPYTYHHIIEKRNGGRRTLDNGAILTQYAHRYLNLLDMKYHDYYSELNSLFLFLNRTNQPPTEEYYEEVRKVLKKVKRWIQY